MTVKMRPHHILCAINFQGKGYTELFVRNMNSIIARLDAGEELEIVDGPDEICACLKGSAFWHCENASVAQRDLDALEALALSKGERILFTKARRLSLQSRFQSGEFKRVCDRCEWVNLCYKSHELKAALPRITAHK